MATYEKYTKKSGKTAWKVTGYLGVDPTTGKQANIEKRGFASKKEASLFFNRKIVEIEKDGFKKKISDNTFESVYRLWLETYEMTVKESSFVKLQQKFNRHILPAFGNKSMEKITVSEVQKFANEMSKKNTQYKEFISNVSRIFKFAIKQGVVEEDPVQKITIPRRTENIKEETIHYYTDEQLKAFLDDTKRNESTKIYTFFYLLANTGARQGEMLGLQWDCIDFNRKTLDIRQTLTRGKNRRLYLEVPKTKKSLRMIPLEDDTIQVLKNWRKVQQKEMLQLGFNTMDKKQVIFTNIENDFIQLTHPRLWMKRICKRANLPILSPHALRHTFATILISQGKDYKTVSELLGHSSIGMTLDTYAGVYDAQKTDAISTLSNLLK